MTETPQTLHVLIVEDEYYIADDLVRALRSAGIVVVGPVANPAAALATIAGSHIDFALVDINLDGTISFDVATALRERGVPFLFLTGYNTLVLPDAFQGVLLMQKPYEDKVVLAEIRRHFPNSVKQHS